MLRIVLQVTFALLVTLVQGFQTVVKRVFPARFTKSVEGDVVLITGTGSGIGRLMAQKFAQLGALVVCVDLDQASNDDTVREINRHWGKAFGYTCDLSVKDNVYEMAKKVRAEVGNVCILVNNAGVVSGKPLSEISDGSIELTFKVNVLAHFWTVKAFLPRMKELRKGHVVTVGSMAGYCGINQMVDYCSAKHANVGFNEALRAELRAEGFADCIRTTIVSPYFISTGMFDGVESSLIPVLDPEWVADQVVKATLRDEFQILLPLWMNPLIVLKTIVPEEGFHQFSRIFGLTTAMQRFHGRHPSAESNHRPPVRGSTKEQRRQQDGR